MIGPSITVRGTLTGEEDLVVKGRIEGEVRLTRDLEITKTAHLAAKVEAATITLCGQIIGDVNALDSLVLEAGAVLIGTVRAPRLVISEGAHFKGRVEMDFDLPELDEDSSPRRR